MITEPENDIMELESIYNEMIHDMANDLTTDYHGQSWVINYYFQRAKKHLQEQSQKQKILEKQLYYRKGGKPTMKVMISQPMSGVPDSEVRRIQSELKEKFGKYHIEVVDSFLTEEVEQSNRPGVFYLGRTLTNFMHNVDAVYFVKGWQSARGCRIEREICKEYGIMILDETFFRQENEVHIKQQFGIDGIRVRDFSPEIYQHIPQLESLEEE